jgi:hypothetical protein
MTGDLEGEAVVWDVYGTVKWTQTDDVISQYCGLALDRAPPPRQVGRAVPQTDAPPAPDDVTFAGQISSSRSTRQKEYQYFDRDLRKALPIKFDGTEQIKGTERTASAVIEETDLNLAADRVGAARALAPGATSGKVIYNTRTIWVEPVSGNSSGARAAEEDAGTGPGHLDSAARRGLRLQRQDHRQQRLVGR